MIAKLSKRHPKKEKSIIVADYKRRIIWLDGVINPEMACKFRRILRRLNRSDHSPIMFYIRGIGGDAHVAFEMMGDMYLSKSPIATVAHGFVNSGCFTITQAGQHRMALKGTRFTFHRAEGCFIAPEPTLTLNSAQLRESLDRMAITDAIQLGWFSRRGRPVKKILDAFMEDRTLDLAQASELNLIDNKLERRDFIKDRKAIRKILKAK